MIGTLAARGRLLRATNVGHWRLNKPTWVAHGALARPRCRPRRHEAEGYAELVRRWLATFGPGTEADIVWWLGRHEDRSSAVRSPPSGPSRSSLDSGGTGWVLPDDVEPVEPVAPWAALLPTLDPP